MTEPTPVLGVPPGYDALGEAKRLLRTIRSGALATVDASGAPFSSLVSLATLIDGRVILLLSGLSAHTRHLAADPRCSLLLARGGKGDPLAHPRLTLTGSAARVTEEPGLATARQRFLARQPKASLYADFPDFSFWIVGIDQAHLNGGFARAARFEAAEILTSTAGCDALVEAERSAVAHMNDDHREALGLYGRVLAKAGEGDWSTSGLDPDGLDLVCGDRVARIDFEEPVRDPGALRGALKHLAERARALGDGPADADPSSR